MPAYGKETPLVKTRKQRNALLAEIVKVQQARLHKNSKAALPFFRVSGDDKEVKELVGAAVRKFNLPKLKRPKESSMEEAIAFPTHSENVLGGALKKVLKDRPFVKSDPSFAEGLKNCEEDKDFEKLLESMIKNAVQKDRKSADSIASLFRLVSRTVNMNADQLFDDDGLDTEQKEKKAVEAKAHIFVAIPSIFNALGLESPSNNLTAANKHKKQAELFSKFISEKLQKDPSYMDKMIREVKTEIQFRPLLPQKAAKTLSKLRDAVLGQPKVPGVFFSSTQKTTSEMGKDAPEQLKSLDRLPKRVKVDDLESLMAKKKEMQEDWNKNKEYYDEPENASKKQAFLDEVAEISRKQRAIHEKNGTPVAPTSTRPRSH